MTYVVQTFSCPRCNRGEFRSLPGPDGKAFCPWCGDAVSGGVAAAPPPPPPAPPRAAVAAPAPVAVPDPPLASSDLAQLLDRVARSAPEDVVRALRERIADMSRACEETSAELREEVDKKLEIKRAVLEEVGRLGSQLAEAKGQAQRKEAEARAAQAELVRAREELEGERRKGVEQASLRERLEERERAARSLEGQLEELRKSGREQQEARDAARRELEQLRAELGKSRAASEAELGEQRRKLAALEARLGSVKLLEAELVDVKAKCQDYRRRLEKEQKESQGKGAAQQAELEKRDQRIRDLQLLIKTLGERLNDLTSRRL